MKKKKNTAKKKYRAVRQNLKSGYFYPTPLLRTLAIYYGRQMTVPMVSAIMKAVTAFFCFNLDLSEKS